MTKSRPSDFLIPFLTVVADSLAIEAAFVFSYWLRSHSGVFSYFGVMDVTPPPIKGYLFGSMFVVPVWLLLFNMRRMYAARRSDTLSDEFFGVIKVVTLGMLIVMSAAFFYRDFSYSRIVFGLLWLTSMSFIFGGRALVRMYERRQYRKGEHLKPAVLIGGDAMASQIHSKLNSHPSFGFNIVGYFAETPARNDLALAHLRYLGPMGGAAQYIIENHIELAFIALDHKDHSRLFELIAECEGINVEFMMVPDVLDILTSQVQVRELEGIPFLKLKGTPLTIWGRILKRMVDIVVSVILLAVCSPAWLLIVLFIKLDSRGPIFFRQERVGLDGKRFFMYKFRSMAIGAESSTGPIWAKERDPRRTRMGVFLRRTSLDEIPQLYNVLKGEMSLVGPRPERPFFVEQFKGKVPKYLDRHRVKTGMTGWAQVNGLRGDTSLEERIKYDLHYIENWSFAFDIKILVRTVRAALMAKGAH
jgi:exopolysaccharide biosynthesis polyprenyl glycosylphosphotransferase